MGEQVAYNQFSGAMSYATAAALAIGSVTTLSSFRAPENVNIKGLEFGATLSNQSAWGQGIFFEIVVNNTVLMTVYDEIGDLLRPSFLQLPINNKDLIELRFYNQSLAALDVASMCKVVI